jgi:hypothetical protein
MSQLPQSTPHPAPAPLIVPVPENAMPTDPENTKDYAPAMHSLRHNLYLSTVKLDHKVYRNADGIGTMFQKQHISLFDGNCELFKIGWKCFSPLSGYCNSGRDTSGLIPIPTHPLRVANPENLVIAYLLVLRIM